MESSKRRVLVVDDELLFRLMMKQLLRSTSYEVVGEAGDGKQAVEQFRDLQPDLVIMDVMMPDIDGVAAVRQILEINANARIVMCSAVGAQRVLIDALNAGARDYVMKPFSRQKVLEALEKASS